MIYCSPCMQHLKQPKTFSVCLMGKIQSLVVSGIEKICSTLGPYIMDFNYMWILSLTSINYVCYIYKYKIMHENVCAYAFKNVHLKQNLLVLEAICLPRLQITKYLFLPKSWWWFFKVPFATQDIAYTSCFSTTTCIHFDNVEHITTSILFLISPVLFYLSELCTLVHYDLALIQYWLESHQLADLDTTYQKL